MALCGRNAIAQRKVWRVGVLANEPWKPMDGLREGLRRHGYVEGQNLILDYRWFQGDGARLPKLAAELVEQKVDVVVTVGTPAVLAAKKASSSVPIVMGLIGDPIAAGVVQSIARPGGNVTGVSVLAAELEPKRLETLKALLPGLQRVAVLGNATNQYTGIAMKHAQAKAAELGLQLQLHAVKGPGDLLATLEALAAARPQAVLVVADQFLLSQRANIAEFLSRMKLPSAHTYREHVEAGGLLSYSTNYFESFHRAAGYVDRIFKGSAPGMLAIEQVDRFELVINARTAGALGITIPPALRVRADQVID